MRGEPGRMKAKWRARESRWEGELWVEPHASLSAAQRSAGSAGAALLSKSTAAQQGGKNEPNIQTQSKRWSQSRRDRWDGRGERKWGTRTLVTTSAGKSKERAWARRGREREGRWKKCWWQKCDGSPPQDLGVTPSTPVGFLLPFLCIHSLTLYPPPSPPSLTYHRSRTIPTVRPGGESCLYRISASLCSSPAPLPFSCIRTLCGGNPHGKAFTSSASEERRETRQPVGEWFQDLAKNN